MNRSRRGFASLVAVALLGLVAVAAVAIFVRTSTDYRRTQYAQQSAQLRQMLLAGATQVMIESKNWPATPQAAAHPIGLPDELTRQGGTMTFTITARKDGACEARLAATLGPHHASQMLTLQRQNDRWKVTSAQLEG